MDEPIGRASLAFNKGLQPDLKKCKTAGKEHTGAIAIIRGKGLAGAPLVPMTSTEKLYCFRYSSSSTYGLLAAKRTSTDCPADETAYEGVNNDYVMFLISTNVPHGGSKDVNPYAKEYSEESKTRCEKFGLPETACGVKD